METFVVRVFVPAREEPLELAGFVEHVGTGQAQRFRGTQALMEIVLNRLEQRPADLTARGRHMNCPELEA